MDPRPPSETHARAIGCPIRRHSSAAQIVPPQDHIVYRSMVTVADCLVDELIHNGIKRVFTVPGESFLEILARLDTATSRGQVTVTSVRHEGAASFMAEAWGKLTNEPAVCLVSRVPGAANMMIGVHTARQDSTPMIAIVGDIKSDFRGREALQEADLATIFKPLAKAVATADDPQQIRSMLQAAIGRSTRGRPGPVVVIVPEDVQASVSDCAPGAARRVPRTPRAAEATIREVLKALDHAEQPVIVAGGGIQRSGAGGRLAEVARMLECPIVTAWRRPDAVPNDDRMYLGMAGRVATSVVRRRLENADVMLAVGTRLSEITAHGYRFPRPTTRVFLVDTDPGAFVSDQVHITRIRSDAADFLSKLAEAARTTPPNVARLQARNIITRRDRMQSRRHLHTTKLRVRDGVDPSIVVKAMERMIPSPRIVTSDAGNFAGWVERFSQFGPSDRYLGPTSGAMGYGLPAAIAAALARPDAHVVAYAGDGGFAMTMSELETAVRYRCRLIAVVFDNQLHGTIRMHQELQTPGHVVATGLGPIDFAAIARGFGARAATVTSADQVDEAIATALRWAGTTVLHIKCDPDAISLERTVQDIRRTRPNIL